MLTIGNWLLTNLSRDSGNSEEQSRSAPEMEGSFSLPVSCPETQSWGENPPTYARWGFPGHNGRDYGYHPVHPAGGGTIDRIGFEAGGYGLYLRIDHGTFWTYYCHLSENFNPYPLNAAIYPHLIIALVGSTGFSSDPHLHWGARRKSYPSFDPWRGYFDQLKLLKG